MIKEEDATIRKSAKTRQEMRGNERRGNESMQENVKSIQFMKISI
jgi:hypothetical protein